MGAADGLSGGGKCTCCAVGWALPASVFSGGIDADETSGAGGDTLAQVKQSCNFTCSASRGISTGDASS